MLAWMLAFATGIYCVLQLAALPSLAYLAGLPILLILAWRIPALRLPVCFLSGCGWMLIHGHLLLAQTLPVELEKTDLLVEGKVTSIPEHFKHYQRFRFEITHLYSQNGDRQAFRLNTRLNWYDVTRDAQPGQVWRLSVRLKRPHGFMNPGGFDYETWLLRQNIRALGYIRDTGAATLIHARQGSYLERSRYHIANQLKQLVSEQYQGLVMALALGDRALLTNSQRQQLNQTGTSHLIAISGLHLGLVAGFVFFLARFGWRQFTVLTNSMPAPLFAAAMAFFAAACYAMLAGFTLPTQRALMMIGVVLVSVNWKRPIRVTQSLALAAMLVLLLDPMSLLATDFWLSFSAVAVILYLLQYRRNRLSGFRRWLHLQFALCVFLMPLLAVAFNQLPVYSIFANLVSIPLIGMLVVPMVLTSVLCAYIHAGLAAVLLGLIAKLIDVFWWCLHQFQQFPFSTLAVPDPGVVGLVSALTGMLLLFMPRGLPARWLGMLFLLPLLFPVIRQPPHGDIDFVLLDVGQGLAALVQTRQHSLLFDTGARFSERFNIGAAVILPYLKYRGIDRLDMLIVSHGDNDHIGGAADVIRSAAPARIISSVPRQLDSDRAQSCQSQQGWVWDGVRFDILHPDTGFHGNENNRSCVLKVTGQHGAILLTGDIEEEAEEYLLATHAEQLAADILVVPHHGSRSSSIPAFIDAVAPDYALIAAGYRNRFNLPNQDILSRYEERTIDTRITYQTGALRAQIGKTGLTVREHRSEKGRFWHNGVIQSDDPSNL